MIKIKRKILIPVILATSILLTIVVYGWFFLNTKTIELNKKARIHVGESLQISGSDVKIRLTGFSKGIGFLGTGIPTFEWITPHSALPKYSGEDVGFSVDSIDTDSKTYADITVEKWTENNMRDDDGITY